MKKVIALILALAMMLTGITALAQITVEVDGKAAAQTAGDYTSAAVSGRFPGGVGDMEIMVRDEMGLGVHKIEVYQLNTPDYAPVRLVDSWQPVGLPGICTLQFNEAVTILGPAGDVFDPTVDGTEVAYAVVVTYGEENGPQEVLNFYADSIRADRMTVSGKAWYPENHATVFGPAIDGSWKTYAIVDLGFDGCQRLKIIGAGAWDLGSVYVSVDGDTVVVDYVMHEDVVRVDVHDDIGIAKEYVNLFTERPTAEDVLEESRFAFGIPFSIEKDLGGEKIVALYTELQVDYPAHSPYVYRFWPNTPANRVIVESMEQLWSLKFEE